MMGSVWVVSVTAASVPSGRRGSDWASLEFPTSGASLVN